MRHEHSLFPAAISPEDIVTNPDPGPLHVPLRFGLRLIGIRNADIVVQTCSWACALAVDGLRKERAFSRTSSRTYLSVAVSSLVRLSTHDTVASRRRDASLTVRI